MNKLRLEVNEIRVDRFDVGSAEEENGTAQGLLGRTVNGTCPPVESCNTSTNQVCRCQ